jgi:hypothetical protein
VFPDVAAGAGAHSLALVANQHTALTGLSWNVDAATDQDIFNIFVNLNVENSDATGPIPVAIEVFVDGVMSQAMSQVVPGPQSESPGAPGYLTATPFFTVTGLAAGAHTIDVRCSTGSSYLAVDTGIRAYTAGNRITAYSSKATLQRIY